MALAVSLLVLAAILHWLYWNLTKPLPGIFFFSLLFCPILIVKRSLGRSNLVQFACCNLPHVQAGRSSGLGVGHANLWPVVHDSSSSLGHCLFDASRGCFPCFAREFRELGEARSAKKKKSDSVALSVCDCCFQRCLLTWRKSFLGTESLGTMAVPGSCTEKLRATLFG